MNDTTSFPRSTSPNQGGDVPPAACAFDMADKLPPHSIEAEQGVLGCIFLAPNECLNECVEKLKAGPSVFYDLRHQTIYGLLVDMYEARVAVDVITVQQRLKDRQQLEAVGGIAYLASLPDFVPSAANLSFYVNIVREKFMLRRMTQSFTSALARVYQHEGEVDGLIEEVEKQVLSIRQEMDASPEDDMKALVQQAVEHMEAAQENKGRLRGIPTGFPDIDRNLRGLKPGQMIIIAARPAQGKTSLAMNIAEHVAVDARIPVGVFSLEMGKSELAYRMLCARARVPSDVAETEMNEGEMKRMTLAASAVAKAPLKICDHGGMTLPQIRGRARRMVQRDGVKLLVIDYLGLIASKARNKYEQVSEISTGLKSLAKELQVPVIVLAQLNRSSEMEGRPPRLSDLRDSGSIEQDADVVAFIHHSEKDGTTLNIEKHRNGPTGRIPLLFRKEITRFDSVSRIREEDVPYAKAA